MRHPPKLQYTGRNRKRLTRRERIEGEKLLVAPDVVEHPGDVQEQRVGDELLGGVLGVADRPGELVAPS